jgi:hypothetical protein
MLAKENKKIALKVKKMALKVTMYLYSLFKG